MANLNRLTAIKMRHRSHRKQFLPFGIIMLVVFPFWGFQKIAEIYKYKTAPLHCIELTISPSDIVRYGEQSGEKYSDIRKYNTYILTTDTAQNRLILAQARQMLNKIKSDKDTLNGIHIVFNDSTKYRDYVKALDDSFEKFPPIFTSYRNDFWSMYTYVDTTGWYERKRERELEKTRHVIY